MTAAVLGLVAGFILVLALLVYILLNGRVHRTIKLGAVIAVTVFYWVQYHALLRFAGWPAIEDLPAEFILIATDIHEPDANNGDPGVMYWWVRESGESGRPPRVYQLPYRSELHEQSANVVEEQKQGAQYVGRKEQGVAPAGGGGGIAFERISKSQRHQKN